MKFNLSNQTSVVSYLTIFNGGSMHSLSWPLSKDVKHMVCINYKVTWPKMIFIFIFQLNLITFQDHTNSWSSNKSQTCSEWVTFLRPDSFPVIKATCYMCAVVVKFNVEIIIKVTKQISIKQRKRKYAFKLITFLAHLCFIWYMRYLSSLCLHWNHQAFSFTNILWGLRLSHWDLSY